MNRIKPLDGLRTFAVLGVLWAHVWGFYKNIPSSIGGFNMNVFLGAGGIGVDLFFVISGFCMYLMYEKKSSASFTLNTYGNFLSKRWKRIAPAFYFVVLFECLFQLFKDGAFPLRSLLYHVTFLNIFQHRNTLSPPFWSLATEWHFYLVLPFIFIKDKQKKWLVFRIVLLMVLCLIIRACYFNTFNLYEGKTIKTDPIWFRFVEFGWGMLAAIFFIQKRSLIKIFQGNFGALLCILIAFSGRGAMITGVYNYFGNYSFIVRALAEPLMTFGFALLVLNVITSQSFVRNILETSWILFLGRISYSMYLWHWLISIFISYVIMEFTGLTNVGLQISFLLSTLALIPVSYLSYRYLELPYFKKQHPAATQNNPAF